MFGGSHNTYRSLWNYYIDTRDLNISDSHLTRGIQPIKIHEIVDMKKEVVDAFLNFCFEYTVLNGTGFSIPDMLAFLEDSEIVIDTSTAYHLLREYNFIWTNQQVYYGNYYQEDRIKELTRFLYQYSNALQLEKSGTHVIVALDE